MSAVMSGRIGELIAALRLEQLGVSTKISPINGFDIIASLNGKLYRVQVKARNVPDTSRPSHYMWTTSSGSRKKKPYTNKECDIIALVSIAHENVFFFAVVGETNVTKRLRVNLFDDRSIAQSSWDQAINKLDDSNRSK